MDALAAAVGLIWDAGERRRVSEPWLSTVEHELATRS